MKSAPARLTGRSARACARWRQSASTALIVGLAALAALTMHAVKLVVYGGATLPTAQSVATGLVGRESGGAG